MNECSCDCWWPFWCNKNSWESCKDHTSSEWEHTRSINQKSYILEPQTAYTVHMDIRTLHSSDGTEMTLSHSQQNKQPVQCSDRILLNAKTQYNRSTRRQGSSIDSAMSDLLRLAFRNVFNMLVAYLFFRFCRASQTMSCLQKKNTWGLLMTLWRATLIQPGGKTLAWW